MEIPLTAEAQAALDKVRKRLRLLQDLEAKTPFTPEDSLTLALRAIVALDERITTLERANGHSAVIAAHSRLAGHAQSAQRLEFLSLA